MDMTMIIITVGMLALMYFMMIRPENKRKKQAEEMRNSLKKGDQITTIGGIVGKIVMVGDENIVIETGDDRVRMELVKWAVSVNNTQQKAAEEERAAKKNKSAKKEEDASEAKK